MKPAPCLEPVTGAAAAPVPATKPTRWKPPSRCRTYVANTGRHGRPARPRRWTGRGWPQLAAPRTAPRCCPGHPMALGGPCSAPFYSSRALAGLCLPYRGRATSPRFTSSRTTWARAHVETRRPEASANAPPSTPRPRQIELGAASSRGPPPPIGRYIHWLATPAFFSHRWVEKRSCPAGPIAIENNGSEPLWIKASRPKAKGKGKGRRQRQGI